jgi:hypothetical protein
MLQSGPMPFAADYVPAATRRSLLGIPHISSIPTRIVILLLFRQLSGTSH